ncbi:Serine carboxypeptidase-like 45 [Stylosanthes scabra]|uniref:Carboxypeptidase n=1 Tax=Stylosanthes scabra TaxID=79078 RepID=A0ABU6YGM5_9FABA|nr:Serine carboxypeptidase-like 45 [Stylosanthes scabra]
MIASFVTIITVVKTVLLVSVVNSYPEADKISSLPGQPRVTFQQYGGYITVDDHQDRALFYYFVEAQSNPASKPLVLWLNGGPGCSSVGVGAFAENGPFRPEANMLYLESPAGVGFSYSSNQSFYDLVTDEITARDNLVFLERWFAKFPEYTKNDFFITGESYAGHYIPQLASLIIQSNTTFSVNLKGIALGNPLLDFDVDLNSEAEYLWSHGLISDSTFELYNTVCNSSQIMREQIDGKVSEDCARVENVSSTEISNYIDQYDVTLDVCLSPAKQQVYMLMNQMNATQNVDVCVGDKLVVYLNREDVQEALHARLVGVPKWSTCSKVLNYDYHNLEIPTLPLLATFVELGIRVLVYSGDQDSVIPLIGSRFLVNGLAREIRLNTTVPYRVWFEGKQVAGWTQEYGNISYATVRGAAHEVPFSQPARSLVLFQAFLQGNPLPSSQ